MLFVFSLQPHSSYASEEDLTQYSTDTTVPVEDPNQDSADDPVTEPVTDQIPLPSTGPNDPQGIIPLLAPVAVAGLTWTLIDSIFAASLGWYVGTAAQDMYKGSVNDKQAASTVQYSMPTSIYVHNDFPDYAGFTIGTSATKHMEAAMVQDAQNRIRNFGNGTNLRLYSSTATNSVMAVIDISSDYGGLVNRHLGNSLDGSEMRDPTYGNEWMNLKGFTIFLISNRASGQLFHAHFTPTRLRDAEIEYNRYVGQFDVQFFPFASHDRKYLQSDLFYGDNKKASMSKRGLLQDSKGNTSVIPRS
jgi:hypothetical protein